MTAGVKIIFAIFALWPVGSILVIPGSTLDQYAIDFKQCEDTTLQIIKRNNVQGIDGAMGDAIALQAITFATAKTLAKGAK